MEIDIIWQQCLILLKENFGEQAYKTWFRFLTANFDGKEIRIAANNNLVHDFIKNKYWDKISSILNELTDGISTKLVVNIKEPMSQEQHKIAKNKQNQLDQLNNETKFTTNNDLSHATNTGNGSNNNNNHGSNDYINNDIYTNQDSRNSNKPKSKARINKELVENLQSATKLNPNYTFDSFVRGNSNQLAYAIGMHITQKPGNKNHNPLFIYGGVGLGKTHLMQAIGNEVHQINPKAKIRYLHANDYIQDVVKASMRQGFDELKKYYNGLDLLLMDDIQFIAGDKTKTQEEFFYTFNTLLDKGKQVIMTCDTYPKNINNLNERLISRFASGLTVEIQPPELEMRVAILKRKAEQNKINLDDDVAFFIAQNVKSNVRELEGALNKVVYQAQFSGKGISLPIAKEALMDILASDNRNVSIDDIQKIICDFYKIRISDLLSAKRTQIISRPRQIAMSLSKELTQHSLPAIGAAFGGRDHTTVIHAQKTVNNLRQADEKFDREYNLLIQMLNN